MMRATIACATWKGSCALCKSPKIWKSIFALPPRKQKSGFFLILLILAVSAVLSQLTPLAVGYLTDHVLAGQNRLVPGAVDLLDYLTGKGYPLYILSNGFSEVQSRKLHSGGIDRYFKRLILSDEIGITKPDRRLFDYALQVVGADAVDTLIVGDNYDADILGAMHAGWRAIYFNRDKLPVTGEQPDYVVTELAEIKQIL